MRAIATTFKGGSMKQYTVAILGATGAVGTQMLECLNEQEFPVGKLKLLASARSAGKTVEFRGEQIVIEEACPEAFEGCDIVLGAAGDDIAKELLPEAVKRGAVVVDNSHAFRMDPEVPLVVPEINADDIKQFAAEVGKSDTDSENTEVVLVEATDSDAASRVETALTNRYNSIFQQNASYSAEKLDMVKNCKVTKDGNFVTMIIGEKASDMLKMFNDSIK